MLELFADPGIGAQFARDGFVTMPFLETEALVRLRELYEEVRSKVTLQGFATTTTSPDLELKQRIFAEVAPLYAHKLDAVFQAYKPLGASFLQKDPGGAGSLPLHQDWTVTDEDHYRTLTIWIPLEDCNEENGALQMLPGSHRWMNLLRGPNLPVAIRDARPQLATGLVTLPLRAGEAVIFDHSIVHGSLLNTSGRPRVAITFGLTHRDTPLRFWYHHPGDPADRFEQLAVPDDFFLRYHQIGQRPDFGQSLGFYRHDLSTVTPEELQQMQHGQSLRRPILRDLGQHACVLARPRHAATRKAAWNEDLASNGYCTFPLLDAGQVAHLRNFFESHQAEKVDRFYASVHHPDIAFRMQVNAELHRVLDPLLAPILADTEPLGGSFIAKPKGNAGILPPHADWNIVDERLWRSYNLWIPLVDTDVANGAIHVIPGSHQWFDGYRGPGIPNPFEPWKNEIWAAMQPLELKAGTALLYDHRLLHASPVNTTGTLRLACVMGIKPKAAPMRYYHGSDGLVSEYAATPEFFLQQNPALGPQGLPLWATVTDQSSAVALSDLQGWLGWETSHTKIPATPEQPVRGFFQTYTPVNILREIRWRLGGKH